MTEEIRSGAGGLVGGLEGIRQQIRWWWMPGSDIFTRRRSGLKKFWRRGSRDVLDAGFGNGWFSYCAWKSGARVTAVALPQKSVDKATALYNRFQQIPKERLSFTQGNLYDLKGREAQFDEIICYETLEHIRDDTRVCRNFFRLLRPGGTLHLCCPNANHPRWSSEILDEREQGGHVRHGYSLESYQNLLEPIGFRISASEGIGGRVLVWMQERLQCPARRWFGEVGAALVACLAIPLHRWDTVNSSEAFSIYIKACKPTAKRA